MKTLLRNLRIFALDIRGAAAAEIALFLILIIVPLLSVADIAFYAYRRMQVDLAAQAAAAAAWTLCDTAGKLPAVKNCNTSSALTNAVNAAVSSTSLGNSVTLAPGYPLEGYYCINGTNGYVASGATATIGGTPTKTANCQTVTGNTSVPADYLQVQVNFTYTPVFTALPITAFLPAQITRTAWMRMG
jgi:hypothetical protein